MNKFLITSLAIGALLVGCQSPSSSGDQAPTTGTVSGTVTLDAAPTSGSAWAVIVDTDTDGSNGYVAIQQGTTTTDKSLSYSISGVTPGAYHVYVVVNNGKTTLAAPSAGDFFGSTSGTVTVTAGATTKVDLSAATQGASGSGTSTSGSGTSTVSGTVTSISSAVDKAAVEAAFHEIFNASGYGFNHVDTSTQAGPINYSSGTGITVSGFATSSAINFSVKYDKYTVNGTTYSGTLTVKNNGAGSSSTNVNVTIQGTVTLTGTGAGTVVIDMVQTGSSTVGQWQGTVVVNNDPTKYTFVNAYSYSTTSTTGSISGTITLPNVPTLGSRYQITAFTGSSLAKPIDGSITSGGASLNYSFAGLSAGTYTVSVLIFNGPSSTRSQTAGDISGSANVTVTAGSTATGDFKAYTISPLSDGKVTGTANNITNATDRATAQATFDEVFHVLGNMGDLWDRTSLSFDKTNKEGTIRAVATIGALNDGTIDATVTYTNYAPVDESGNKTGTTYSGVFKVSGTFTGDLTSGKATWNVELKTRDATGSNSGVLTLAGTGAGTTKVNWSYVSTTENGTNQGKIWVNSDPTEYLFLSK